MTIVKTYATEDDLRLQKDALLAIISLNEILPRVNKNVWVTRNEMTNRLIYCGVSLYLQDMDVADAISKCNRDGRLERRRYKGGAYFRPSIFNEGSPKDQREGRTPPMNPKKNFFKKASLAKGLVQVLDKDLERLKQIRDGIVNGDIIREHDIIFIVIESYSSLFD